MTLPDQITRLLATKIVPCRARGIVGLTSPLVGRETEFRAMHRAIARLQEGDGGIVTLIGEAGLGKSRLVAELRAQFIAPQERDSAHLCWIEGRCLSYGVSITYLLWLDVLRGLLGVTMEDPPLAVRDVLHRQVRATCTTQFNRVYPFLAQLLSLPLDAASAAVVRDLAGEKLKIATFRAVETFVEAVAWQQPLVIVCEDLHWADHTSIDLLEQLLSLTYRAPLLLICVFRPEMAHSCWRIKETAARRYRPRHTDISLEPLSAARARR